MWKVYGRRLDGFDNEDIPSPKLDYEDEQSVLNWCHHSQRYKFDVDYTGSVMPPAKAVAGTFKGPNGQKIKVAPLSDEDKLTLARWIDIGCPIDLDYDPDNPNRRGRGWMLDEGRPTLTLTYPRGGRNSRPLSRILIGMHDYYSGIDAGSFSVTASVPIDGVKSGTNLAGKFTEKSTGIWELKLSKPIETLRDGTLVVSVKDQEGNITRIERTFSVVPGP
jgi:hypothetical protein